MAYNYRYRLTIRTYGWDKSVGKLETKEPIEPEVVIENPIKISFNVNASPYSGGSTATIDVFNLNETTRSSIFIDYFLMKKIRFVFLEAGYEAGENKGKYDLLFAGQARVITSSRNGVDVVTHIEAFSGLNVADASMSVSLKEGVSEEEVIKQINVSELGINSGIQSFNDYVFIRPPALYGNKIRLLQEYTNGRSFIDRNTHYILNDFETADGYALLIDDNSGLLSTPKRTELTVQVSLMFEPLIHPGYGVEIRSSVEPTFSGQYKVYSVKHSGTISVGSNSNVTTEAELFVGEQALGRFGYD